MKHDAKNTKFVNKHIRTILAKKSACLIKTEIIEIKLTEKSRFRKSEKITLRNRRLSFN